MKKTLVEGLPKQIPQRIAAEFFGARVYDSSSSNNAQVYYIEKDGGYYLKIGPKDSLGTEAVMTEFFHSKGLGPQVLCYESGENDLLLTPRVAGEDCTAEAYLADPKRLCDLLATELRRLHEMDFSGCPVGDRTAAYLAFADENYKKGAYDPRLFHDSFGFASADAAYGVLTEGRSAMRADVLLHGDYCLPNVVLDGWRLSGFVDLGGGGVGDRHIDIFWGLWSLWYNTKTDKYTERFLDAYGRDKLERHALRAVAAAEVFG